MSNAIYPKFADFLLGVLLTSTVKAQLVDTAGYAYSAAHEFLSDIPGGARVGVAVTLTGKAVANRAFDAANSVWAGLADVPTTEALALYIDTGDENTSRLVCWIDTADGLPIAAGATGGTVTWDNGANRILALR